jgi:hypothetical protein
VSFDSGATSLQRIRENNSVPRVHEAERGSNSTIHRRHVLRHSTSEPACGTALDVETIRMRSSCSEGTDDHTVLVALPRRGMRREWHRPGGSLPQTRVEATRDCLRMDYPVRMVAREGIHKDHPRWQQMAWQETGRIGLQTDGLAWNSFQRRRKLGTYFLFPEYAFILSYSSFRAFDSQNPRQDLFVWPVCSVALPAFFITPPMPRTLLCWNSGIRVAPWCDGL